MTVYSTFLQHKLNECNPGFLFGFWVFPWERLSFEWFGFSSGTNRLSGAFSACARY